MRPTFMGFETARKGLVANQKAIDIVGHNITNITTPGYTRQRVDFVSMSLSSQGSRFALSKTATAGQGVTMTGVSQTRDAFLDKRFREEFGDVGYYDESVAILSDIESALDEITSNGLKDGLKKVMESLQNFSKNPDQITHANIFMTASKNLTQVLKQFDTKLNNIMEQQKFNLEVGVSDVNSMLERISNLNNSIVADRFVTGATTSGEYYGPNELMDERNLLLDELSKFGDVSVTDMSDGAVKVVMNGQTVVEGDIHDKLNMIRNDDNTVGLLWQSTGKDPDFTKGTMKAMTDLINGGGFDGKGNQGITQGIPYYKQKIDTFAQVFSDVFNETIQVEDPDGNVTYKKLFESSDPNNPVINAGNMTISEEWSTDPSYIIKGLSKINTKFSAMAETITGRPNAATLSLSNNYVKYNAATGPISYTRLSAANAGLYIGSTGIKASISPATPNGTTIDIGMSNVDNKLDLKVEGLAANTSYNGTLTLTDEATGRIITMNVQASANGATPPVITTTISEIKEDPNAGADGRLDNTFIIKLVDSFNKDQNFGEFKGTYEKYVNFYNTNLGQQKEFSTSRLKATGAIADDLLNRRDNVSGVSMDEEGSNMMMFDKAYKAVSRVMTTMDEMLDILISKTGLVGR